jgi:hypothetical protein
MADVVLFAMPGGYDWVLTTTKRSNNGMGPAFDEIDADHMNAICDAIIRIDPVAIRYVYNNTGGNLAAGTCVRLGGGESAGYPYIVKGDNASVDTLPTHILPNAIADDEKGMAIRAGGVTYDTSTMTDGDILYVSATAGELTKTVPATGLKALVGVCHNKAGGVISVTFPPIVIPLAGTGVTVGADMTLAADTATVMMLAGAQNITGVKTITTGGQINGGTVADGITLPSVAPTLVGGVGVDGADLKWGGTGPTIYTALSTASTSSALSGTTSATFACNGVAVILAGNTDLAKAHTQNTDHTLTHATVLTLAVGGSTEWTVDATAILPAASEANSIGSDSYVVLGATVKTITFRTGGTTYGSITVASNYMKIDVSNAAGTLILDAEGSHSIQVGGTTQWKVDGTALYPYVTDSEDLGTASYMVKNIYLHQNLYYDAAAHAPADDIYVGVRRIVKTTTGDPSTAIEGDICINKYDNNVKIYADGGWRQLVTW